MSGGALDYFYSRVENVAGEVALRARTPLHRAFAAHLRKVSQALHDIEWLFSHDYSPGQEEDAIRACLGAGEELHAAIDQARAAAAELQAVLNAAER